MSAPLILHDDSFRILRLSEELESRMMAVCVDCGRKMDAGYELDASARCDDCRP